MNFLSFSFIIPLLVVVLWTIFIIHKQSQAAQETFSKAFRFSEFFPRYNYSIKDRIVPNIIFESDARLLEFASFPEESYLSEGTTLKLIVCDKRLKDDFPYFSNVMQNTNAYLCKNQGNADFNILKDICEREIQKLQNEIESSIQLPLYWGLGGTFGGIIFGTGLLAIFQMFNIDEALSTVHLLITVAIAMIASAFGLYYTVRNSTEAYKNASLKNDEDKQDYLNYLQRELLPSMNKGINDSLNKIQTIFQGFQYAMSNKFTENISLLKDTLDGQTELMVAIKNMDVVRTSSKIADVWGKIEIVSNGISEFQSFQKSINVTLNNTDLVLSRLTQTISHLEAFNENINSLSEHVLATRHLEEQFKESLEQHFPSHEEPRKIWRQHLDELNNDVKGTYQNLDTHFKETTLLMKDFTQNNGDFFKGIKILQDMAKMMEEKNRSQTEAIEAVQADMRQITKEMKYFAEHTFALNKDVVRLMERFSKSI